MFAHFECLRGYHVKTLAFVKSMTSPAVKNEISFEDQDPIRKHGGKNSIQTSNG